MSRDREMLEAGLGLASVIDARAVITFVATLAITGEASRPGGHPGMGRRSRQGSGVEGEARPQPCLQAADLRHQCSLMRRACSLLKALRGGRPAT